MKQLHSALAGLDAAWATYEHKHISELILIEAKARSYIMDAIEQERCLTNLISCKVDQEEKLTVVNFQASQSLGIEYFDISGTITSVVSDSPADRAGIKAGWIMVSIDGEAFSEQNLLARREGSCDFAVTFKRQKESITQSSTGLGLVCSRRRLLVESINQLNSRANHQGKGRADLDVTILEEGMALLESQERGAGFSLATDVVAAFDALCNYFRTASTCIAKVDPHLAQNPGLVERLVEWEASWELFTKYRKNTLLDAVTDVVTEIHEVQQVTPSLKQMCGECDAELFMCVPRLLWLRFLEDPAACGELFRTLLPHRFPTTLPHLLRPPLSVSICSEGSVDSHAGCPDATCAADIEVDLSSTFAIDVELSHLQCRYQRVCQHILQTWRMHGGTPPQPCSRMTDNRSCHKQQTHPAVWELLARRAVVGSDGADKVYTDLMQPRGCIEESTTAPVEEFMRELERWSMELQRHAPEEWNECSSIILQCVMGEKERVPAEFKV